MYYFKENGILVLKYIPLIRYQTKKQKFINLTNIKKITFLKQTIWGRGACYQILFINDMNKYEKIKISSRFANSKEAFDFLASCLKPDPYSEYVLGKDTQCNFTFDNEFENTNRDKRKNFGFIWVMALMLFVFLAIYYYHFIIFRIIG